MGSKSTVFILTKLAIFVLILASLPSILLADLSFQRGDANGDGTINIADGSKILGFLFLSNGGSPECESASDANDSGKVDISDASFIFNFLFTGGRDPFSPYPGCGADPTPDTLACTVYDHCPQGESDLRDIGHLLNRIAYGVSPADIASVESMGLEAFIEEQLNPHLIDESDNTELLSRESELFEERVPSKYSLILRAGEVWRYRKGTSEPPADWMTESFVDSGPDWLLGVTGIGYGDGDDVTVLDDMRQLADNLETPLVDESQPGYLSITMRKEFNIKDLSSIDSLILRMKYDDGFACYLNGVEVARTPGLDGNPPAYNQGASSHEAVGAEDFDITVHKNLLHVGSNLLAIQAHNTSITSSDLSMIPELISREILPGPTIKVIRGVNELQQLVHIRGVYSRKQLQAVLAEFWENHFTTDTDKVAAYFDELQNSDANDAMTETEARSQAAQVEFTEYQFFYENALGDFGDLLLYSASSPAMLIYLDSVLNFKAEPNENYPREILELSAFGVDNRYVQKDIEELAKSFTGWSICKVRPEDVQPFADSARNPLTACAVEFTDTTFLGLGAGWKYFKGTQEPSPDTGGNPTTEWTAVEFSDDSWLDGSTGIGYDTGDGTYVNTTTLSDMPNSYLSVYLRREFTVLGPLSFKNLILQMDFDDGFIAYVNGVEVARSESMEDTGSPPSYTQVADGHEADLNAPEIFNVHLAVGLLRPSPEKNVLAIQVHNASLDSSDLTLRPRLIDRVVEPGSIENGDPNGVWVFRFNPDQHHLGTKTLFEGYPLETINTPAGRKGQAGVLDAIEVMDAMANHPSTQEFICIKLIQKFVSDDISLVTFKDQTAPIELRALLAECIATWSQTNGNIEAVMRVILDPQDRSNVFWSDLAYRSKVKSPIELINSSLRIVNAQATGENLPGLNADMGMTLFVRNDPDGFAETPEWLNTDTLLVRTNFVGSLAANLDEGFNWDVLALIGDLETAEENIDFFTDLMFQNTMPQANKDLLLDFLTTDTAGNPLPFSSELPDFESRVRDLVGIMMSMPLWQFQ